MGRPIFTRRYMVVVESAEPLRDSSRLAEAVRLVEAWVTTWTNRFSPRFHDPTVVSANAKVVRRILDDHSITKRIQRWFSGTKLEYDPTTELESVAANSGRIRLVDYSTIDDWAEKALESLKLSATKSLRIAVLRCSFKDDTSLYLDLKTNLQGDFSIDLVVYSFAALEDKEFGERLTDRLEDLTKSRHFQDLAEVSRQSFD